MTDEEYARRHAGQSRQKYTVTFMDDSGRILRKSLIRMGDAMNVPAVHQTFKRHGKVYTFQEWSPQPPKTVTCNGVYTAVYAESSNVKKRDFLPYLTTLIIATIAVWIFFELISNNIARNPIALNTNTPVASNTDTPAASNTDTPVASNSNTEITAYDNGDHSKEEYDSSEKETAKTADSQDATPEPAASSAAPFYGVWYSASRQYEVSESKLAMFENKGYHPLVVLSCEWSNLNQEPHYVVSAGRYNSREEAEAVLSDVQSLIPDAYIKYSGDYIG